MHANKSCALFDEWKKNHTSITFTKEKKLNNQLAFLDVLITRKIGRFLTSVYRNSSFTGKYLNFQSSCSKKSKIGLIKP